MSSGIDSVTHPPDDTRYLVIEIGGTKLQLCIGTADGVIVDRRRFLVERSGGAPAIRALIEQAARELVSQWKPAAIAVVPMNI